MLIMKRKLCLAALLAVALPSQAQQAELPPPANGTTHPQLQRTLKEIVGLIAIVTELLEGVQDKATADAAAPKVQACMSLIAELSPALEYIQQAELNSALQQAGLTPEHLKTSRTQLEAKRFYGSMALATALGLPPYAAVGLSEPGPELLEELGRELSSAVAGKVPGLSGGPGLTEATAWKMGADANQLQHIRTIMEAIPGAIKEEQTLVRTQEGPIYGRMTFILARGDKCYRLQMWFDITAYIRAEEAARAAEPELPPAHTDTPEAPAEELPQPQASVTEFAEAMLELHSTLQAVKNKLSAFYAARKLGDIRDRIREAEEMMPNLPPAEVQAALQAAGVNAAAIRNEFNRLREADYYGSESLREAIDTHFPLNQSYTKP